jgi:Domain of unknown function (DUF4157)
MYLNTIISSEHSDRKNKNHSLSPSFFFQPKLSVNQPNDPESFRDEQEADTVAEKVTGMNDSSTQKLFFRPPAIQRKCAHCEEEEKKAQRKESNNETIEASAQTENYIASLSGGKQLSKNERDFFEPGLGYDFSNVRLHTGNEANQSAENINALAYTHGNDIVFASNQYQPGTNEGRKLLAHELTHVVQQNNNADISRNSIQRDGPTTTVTATGSIAAPATSNVSIAANCNQADVTDIVTESLTWLDDIYQQLLEFDADEVFMGNSPSRKRSYKNCRSITAVI